MGMTGLTGSTIPGMREIVIVISDVYLPERAAVAPLAFPGLDRISRFGEQLTLGRGWRDWLARWAGRHDLEQAPVSAIAGAGQAAAAATWMATPLHLAAGLTTLHFDARGILRLSREELDELALDFGRTFADVSLVPLESGEFLLLQSAAPAATTTSEPARIVGGNVADALPQGSGAATLRRLGAEIEMWLHEHPVNVARAGRGEPPISTLWIWGGGARMTPRRTSGGLARAFGSDSYLQGLWRLCGGAAQSLPQRLDATYAESVVLVVEAGRMSRANTPGSSAWSMAERLGEVDRRFVAPAVEHLQRRALERVSILANDRLLFLSSGSQRKFWRRPRPALERLR
jgi:hypothetical protein